MHLLKFAWSQLARNAWKNRQELIAAGLGNRRDLMKLGLLSTSGFLLAKHGLSSRVADAKDIVSPPTTPWAQALPIAPVKRPLAAGLAGLAPYPTVEPNNLGGEGRTRSHQAFTEYPDKFRFADITRVYETTLKETTNHKIALNLPAQNLWGYDGMVPGPTYYARYGEQMLVRNRIGYQSRANNGYGIQRHTTHLHNGHTPSESDGFPDDYFPNPNKPAIATASFYDHHYPNALAGFSDPATPDGDIRESMGSLWYHDHMHGYTAQNTYKGLTGFYVIYNHLDTGDERTGFRLPGVRSNPADFYSQVQYDVPLMFCDRVVDPSSGQMYFDLFNTDGIIGDKFLVNGKVQPYFEVEPRRYRFRMLSGGPSRFLQIFLTDRGANTTIAFWQIANDGNLLPRPIKVTSTAMAVAERADIVIDFSKWKGKTLYLENRLLQSDGRGADENVGHPLSLSAAGAGKFLLQFRVKAVSTVADNSVDFETNPNVAFYDLPPVANNPRITRNFRFERSNGSWVINGKPFPEDENSPAFQIQRGSAEHWTWQNNSGGWMHPVHSHFEEFRMVNRNGKVIGPGNVEYARKDVLRLGHGELCKVAYRFRDFKGRYPLHCHNTLHEDTAMMMRWEIADVGDNKTNP